MKRKRDRSSSTRFSRNSRTSRRKSLIIQLCLPLLRMLQTSTRPALPSLQDKMVSSIHSQTLLRPPSSTTSKTRTRATSLLSKMLRKTKWLLILKALVGTKKTTILKVLNFCIRLWDLITSYWDLCWKLMDSHTLSLMNGMSYGELQIVNHICTKV